MSVSIHIIRCGDITGLPAQNLTWKTQVRRTSSLRLARKGDLTGSCIIAGITFQVYSLHNVSVTINRERDDRVKDN